MVDRYAGDEAWTQWFERCQVAACGDAEQRLLTEEIKSGLSKALTRHIAVTDFCEENLVSYFDEYFGSNRSQWADTVPVKKALKLKLWDERNNVPDKLKGIVLGRIFAQGGRKKGYITNIAIDAIPAIKGWQARWIKVPLTGKKRLVWERAVEKGEKDSLNPEEILVAPANDSSLNLDYGWFLTCSREFLTELASKNNCENLISPATMIYAWANKISATRDVVQRLLGVKHVKAQDKINKAIEFLCKFCKRKDLRLRPDGEGFVQVLLKEVENQLGNTLLKELENAK